MMESGGDGRRRRVGSGTPWIVPRDVDISGCGLDFM